MRFALNPRIMPKHPIQLEARRRVAALLAIPVLVGLSMWLLAREASRRDDLVKHALMVELSLERLTSELTEAESAQRGIAVGQTEIVVGVPLRRIPIAIMFLVAGEAELQRVAALLP